MFRTVLAVVALVILAEPTAVASIKPEQVFDSALAYGRSVAEARQAANVVEGKLALQVYLTLSTPAYFAQQSQALEAVKEIQSHFAFQVYLTLRTPAYRLTHAQSLLASQQIKNPPQLQLYLHLLVSGLEAEAALSQLNPSR